MLKKEERDRVGTNPEEIIAFHRLQEKMPKMFEQVSSDRHAEHTSVIVPSMSSA